MICCSLYDMYSEMPIFMALFPLEKLRGVILVSQTFFGTIDSKYLFLDTCDFSMCNTSSKIFRDLIYDFDFILVIYDQY